MNGQFACYGRNHVLIRWGFIAAAAISSLSLVSSIHADTVIFGSGANSFSMVFVTIGNPGNAADTTGYPSLAGAVGYEYGIGKFEVSEDMITKFNASQSLQITKDTRGTNKPATMVSWNEAARFINWLNTSTGGSAAYKFTTGGVDDNIALWTAADALDYDAANPYRSKRATYVLPSSNEWYKAAYYNPDNSTYYNYTNGSDTAPTPVSGGTVDNTAVYGQSVPADVDQAGGLSPYGVMGLGGNAAEWQESSVNLANNNPLDMRLIRGGNWVGSSTVPMLSTSYDFFPAVANGNVIGFRVARVTPAAAPVPEPGIMGIGTLVGLGGLAARRRIRKQLVSPVRASPSQGDANDRLIACKWW